jgi:hypothetical protein
MGTIYLANTLCTILIYSKYIPFNVTIILRPFMIIIIFEYTSNMVVHIHPKYTFINPNTTNYIFFNSQNTHLYLIGLHINWSHLQLMGHKSFFLDEN